MRGIFFCTVDVIKICRFNPAYAGNIFVYARFRCFVEVQPRVCGEYMYLMHLSVLQIGSTPRMRGICSYSPSSIVSIRFNPAYAGNIENCIHHITKSKVQPRVCGEYRVVSSRNLFVVGSTPRMRGILISRERGQLLQRFNPAYAGNIFTLDLGFITI